jgi:hypothetical protein
VKGRHLATALLVVVGSVFVLLGVVAGYLNRTVLDTDTFVDRVDILRRDPAVSRALGRALADAYLDRTPDAVAIRPLLDTVGRRSPAPTSWPDPPGWPPAACSGR